MDLDNSVVSNDDDSEQNDTQPRPKDKWDKWNIILKPVGGLITAIAVIILGYLTSNYLEMQKQNETDVRLYTQLMSERERAEQSLRTTMFQEIFDRVLKQPSKNQSTKNQSMAGDGNGAESQTQVEGKGNESAITNKDLRRIRTHVVGIDMISRNFHEFLDMKPLFLYVLREIVVMRGEEKDRGETDCDTVGEGWNAAKPCQELLWEQGKLVRMAGRVLEKQFNILKGNGQTVTFGIPLDDLCQDENWRTLLYSDRKCDKGGFSQTEHLSLKFGKCMRKATFKISVNRAYPEWNMVRTIITWSVANEAGCGENSAFKTTEQETKKFWVGSFDFPMIDNTYMSTDERFAVFLDKMDREEGKVTLKLVYFPAADAGLQEKSYYQQKLLERLINRSGLFGGSVQR
jgi:hypothetical protein